MSTLQNDDITMFSRTTPLLADTDSVSDGLWSTQDCQDDYRAEWSSLIDQLLDWASHPDTFDEGDAPTSDVLETALDWAQNSRELEPVASAPSSMIASGGGKIAFEWSYSDVVFIVEFYELGAAIAETYVNGKLEQRASLYRNPKSRKMEQVSDQSQ